MFADRKLEQIALQKRALIAQGEMRLAMLQIEWIQLQQVTSRLDAGLNLFKKGRPLLLVLAPFLGLMVTRRWKKLALFLPFGVMVWKMVRAGRFLWEEVRQHFRTA